MMFLKDQAISVFLLLVVAFIVSCTTEKKDSDLLNSILTCPRESNSSESNETFIGRGYVKSIYRNNTYLFRVEEVIRGYDDIQVNNEIEFFVNNFYRKTCGTLLPGDHLQLYIDTEFNLLRAANFDQFPGKSFIRSFCAGIEACVRIVTRFRLFTECFHDGPKTNGGNSQNFESQKISEKRNRC